jgi:response regulator RpfG family c-di-GMP phosphodiesterase
MKNILVVYDSTLKEVECALLLNRLNVSFVLLSVGEIKVDEALFTEFALIIIETGQASTKLYELLDELNRYASLSGLERPVVMLAADDNSNISEQHVRGLNTDFFFLSPIDEKNLETLVRQVVPA